MKYWMLSLLFVGSAFGQLDSPDAMTLRKLDSNQIVSMLSCGNRNFAAIAGMTLNSSGIQALDNYYSLSGTNSWLYASDAPMVALFTSGTAPFTCAAWYRQSGKPSDASGGIAQLMGRRAGGSGANYWEIFANTNNSMVRFIPSSPGVPLTNSASFYDGGWHFVAVSYSTSQAILVVDGNVVTGSGSGWPGVTSSQPLSFGAEVDNARLFAGKLLLPKYWNRALSAKELLMFYETERLKVIGQ